MLGNKLSTNEERFGFSNVNVATQNAVLRKIIGKIYMTADQFSDL